MLHAFFWSAMTIALYFVAKSLHRRWRVLATSPLVLTPLLLIALALSLHESYGEYIRGTGWLVTLLGPATVAFAVPIWERRTLIRRYWPVLIVGIAVGSTTSIATAWGLATLLKLNRSLLLTLLPRSISTPFAMPASAIFGGVPALTAIFVIFTGIFGAALGEIFLLVLPLRSVMARGAMFGMGAHAVGTQKAYQIGHEEGAVAGVVMVLAGVMNVVAAPLLARLFR